MNKASRFVFINRKTAKTFLLLAMHIFKIFFFERCKWHLFLLKIAKIIGYTKNFFSEQFSVESR